MGKPIQGSILAPAAIMAVLLLSLVVVIHERREYGPESDREVERALSVMGVTPASGPAADIELEALSGGHMNLNDLSGKVVFLNFWATWCAPCVAEMPAMQRLADELGGDGLSVVAVNVREYREPVQAFVERLELEYTVLLDFEGRATRDYNIRGYPTTVIIGRDGQLIGTKMGFHDWDDSETIEAFATLLDRV